MQLPTRGTVLTPPRSLNGVYTGSRCPCLLRADADTIDPHPRGADVGPIRPNREAEELIVLLTLSFSSINASCRPIIVHLTV